MSAARERDEAKESEDSDADGLPDSADAAPAPARGNMFGAPAAPAQPAPRPAPEGAPAPPAEDAPRAGELLVYTAQITMAVYQVEAALDAVEQIARAEGGYLATRADQQITIRVPRARFEDALQKVEGAGDVVHRDVQAQDVTDEFRDVEVRLKNARAMRDRLEALLAKAPVKEALEIERELGRVTEEIERMQGRLKVLRDKIAYSTITVTCAPRAASLKTMPTRLPFPWLGTLGLPTLLRLDETKR